MRSLALALACTALIAGLSALVLVAKQPPEALVDAAVHRGEHPVLAPHPRTGDEVVMANQMHSDSIVGLPAAESDALLRDLFAVLYDESNVLRYDWSVGDLVLWDNIAVQHGRPDFPVDQPRTLQRVVLGDYTPGELVPNLEELLAARPGGSS